MTKTAHPSVIIFNTQLEIEKDEIMEMAKQTDNNPIVSSLVAFGKMMWNLGRVFKQKKYDLEKFSIAKVRHIIKNDEAPMLEAREVLLMSDVIRKAMPAFFDSCDLNTGVIKYGQCLLVGGWLYQTAQKVKGTK